MSDNQSWKHILQDYKDNCISRKASKTHIEVVNCLIQFEDNLISRENNASMINDLINMNVFLNILPGERWPKQ